MSRSRRVFRLGLFSFRRMCAKPVRQMCAKPAENRPSDSSRGNGKDPARSVRGPAAGLSVSPFGPSVTVLLAPLLPVCLPACLAFCPSARLPLGRLASATPRLPLGVRLCPPARLPLAPSPRTAAHACRSPQAKGGPPHGTARPSALDIPLCAWPFACPLAWPFARPLGYPSPHRRGPPRPRADHPKRKADRSPRNGPPLGARYSLMR